MSENKSEYKPENTSANTATNAPASRPETDKPINPAEVRRSAMNLLARREHAYKELKQKLCKRFDDEALVDEQLQRLAEENLQSDQRFVESFVRQRIIRGHGPLRIERDARQKGISSAELQQALDDAAVDWCQLAREVLLKKFGHCAAVDLKEKSRRARFMQYRGFLAEQFDQLLV